MIKEEKVLVNITERNINYYKKLDYDVEINDILSVDVSDISKGSHIKITSICSNCNKEKVMTYYNYNKNCDDNGDYLCSKCKRDRTFLNRYNVKNPMMLDDIKNKVIKTNINRYGVKTTLLVDDIKDRIKKTNKERYGTEQPLSSIIVRDKIKKTTFKNWGVEHFSKTQQFYKSTFNRWKNMILDKLNKYEINDFIINNDRTIDIKCDMGENHYFNINSKNLYQRKEIQNTILCTKCNPIIGIKQSGVELQILNFIKYNYNGIIYENYKDLIDGELDIYIPELKLAFEFNGIYWHSDLYKDKNYHLNKTELCEEKGIQLIHIYEDEWKFKQEIVKSRILNSLGKIDNKIYARKCDIKEIYDNKLVRDFLNNNHIQGFIGSSIKIGLFYNDDLVSLMTFGKKRISMGSKSLNKEYELLRFCSKNYTNVVGGANKLFNYFVNKYNPIQIITYADRSWSIGNLYEKLGFEFVHKTPPNYFYFDRFLNRYNRFNFRKDVLIKKGYDSKLTECEIMDRLNYYRVFNSGNLKFIFNI